MTRGAVATIALVFAAGCDSGSATKTAASSSPAPSSAPASTSAASQPSSAVAPPAPDDLDVASLQKALKCAADAKSGACGVLAKYASCSTWSGVSPSGDGRWFGRGFLIEGGKTTEQFTLVRTRSVPSADVGPGQVPAKLALGEIVKEDGAAYDQTDKAIRAMERGDVPQRASPTMEYIKKRSDWQESFATKTAGGQVYMITQSGAYLCQGQKQTLLLVRKAATRSGQGDGLYAELWPASW